MRQHPPVSSAQAARSGLKPHFWVGLGLLALGHVLIFARTAGGEHVRPWSDYWFAAVWFGYIFTLDALLYRRDGRSLVVTYRPLFLLMLPLSAMLWWGFEWINSFVHNWEYQRPYDIPDWWANLVSCVFFSTVIPAIWETAEWVKGWRLLQRMREHDGVRVTRPVPFVLMAVGVIFFALAVIWPLYCFPLIWGFLVLVLDPINYLRGVPSILGQLSRGRWKVPLAFYIAGTICGILWEAWNFWAFPKWTYNVPFVGFLKIFEMPLLGYIGYGPFAWEVYSFCQFVSSLLTGRRVGETREAEAPHAA